MKLWIIARVYAPPRAMKPGRWTIEGCFRKEARALAECTDDRDWVMPLELDVRLPEVMAEAPGGYWAIVKRPELIGRRAA